MPTISNLTANKELPVKITILKRGGSDVYENGRIIAETDKAVLVIFTIQKKQVWVPKKMVWDNGDNYGVKAKLWNSWERLTMEELKEENNIDNNSQITE